MKKVKVLRVNISNLESQVNSFTKGLDVDDIQFFQNAPESVYWTVIVTYNVKDKD